jgi:hypothetical protein
MHEVCFTFLHANCFADPAVSCYPFPSPQLASNCAMVTGVRITLGTMYVYFILHAVFFLLTSQLGPYPAQPRPLLG